MISALAIGCVSSWISSASAGGQLEQPSLVNNSTSTGVRCALRDTANNSKTSRVFIPLWSAAACRRMRWQATALQILFLVDAHQRLDLFLLLIAFQERNALLHPFRRRRALQHMIEVLLQTHRVILLVDALAQAVRLAVV